MDVLFIFTAVLKEMLIKERQTVRQTQITQIKQSNLATEHATDAKSESKERLGSVFIVLDWFIVCVWSGWLKNRP